MDICLVIEHGHSRLPASISLELFNLEKAAVYKKKEQCRHQQHQGQCRCKTPIEERTHLLLNHHRHHDTFSPPKKGRGDEKTQGVYENQERARTDAREAEG